VSSRAADNMIHWEEGSPNYLAFVVYGTPHPQGSKRAFRKGDKVVMAESTTSRAWRQEVVETILSFELKEPLLGACQVELTFYLKRPKHHYGTGRNAHLLKGSAPGYVEVRPDADKLARTILDAMTLSNLIRDDGQVAVLTVAKRYGEKPGVRVVVRSLT